MTPDRIKEELQWLRATFPVIAALEAGVIAYSVQPTTPRFMLGVAAAGLIAGTWLLAALVIRVYRLLQKLE